MRLGIRRALFILPLLVLAFTGVLSLWTLIPKVAADSAVFTTHPWYDSAGNTLSNITNKSFAARFTFTDTATIVDVQTQTQYVLTGADPALEFNGNAIGNGLSTNCASSDPHNTYETGGCNSGNGHHPKNYYWYWPSNESDSNGQAGNGKCMGGFLVSDNPDDGSPHLYINFIPTVGNSSGCNVYDQTSGSVPTGSMNDDDFHNSYAGLQKAIEDNHNPVQDPSVNNYGSTLDFAGYLQWSNADQISIIAGASPAFELVTDQDEINHIHAHLENGQKHAPDYADSTKYSYYVASACSSSGGHYSVFLAVPSIGSDAAYILHDDAPDADNSSNKAYGDWSGKDYNCLFGNGDENHNPIELLQGSTDNSDIKVLLTSTQNSAKTLADYNGPTPTNPTGDASKAPTLDCHVTFYNPLSWFLCPLASGLASVAGGLDNAINSALDFNPQSLNTYEKAFSSFRDISLGLIVLGMLVAVISQALGMELLDAYTVRRVLPRLLMVVVGIALAEPLIKFMINVSDGLGEGIRSIIYLAAQGHQAGGGTVGFGGGATVTEGVLAMGAIAALGFVGVLSFAATAALAAAVAYLVLILRQMVIILLFMLAPIAFVAYLLPNTERAWKLWWDSFSKALLMFPIIAAFIALGRTFASISSNTLIAFVCYFGPYFLLPLTFRFAGGILGNMAGAVHNTTGGMRKGLNQFRTRRAQQRLNTGMTAARSGNAFASLNRFESGRRLNRGLAAVSTGAVLPGVLGRGARSRMSTNLSGSVNQGAKILQEAGLQDDGSLNEYAQNWNRVGARIGELRSRTDSNGVAKSASQLASDHQMADQLSAFQQFNGNRNVALGAMKTAASFGKLSDRSLEKMDTMFGSSAAESAAKQAAFGDLIFTSKNAGNYVTYAARMDKNGKVQTYSGADADQRASIQENLDKSLMEAGPQVISSIKPYTDNGVSVKQSVADSLARNAMNSGGNLDVNQHARAMENFVMAEMSGAYSDPNMKAALDNAKSSFSDDAQRLYAQKRQEVVRTSQFGEDGRPVGPPPGPTGGSTGTGNGGDWRNPNGYM